MVPEPELRFLCIYGESERGGKEAGEEGRGLQGPEAQFWE